MPKEGSKKLDEELRKVTKEEIKESLQKKGIELAVLKRKYRIIRLKHFFREIFYALIITSLLGFCLWAWFPSVFSLYRSVALGILFYLSFEELRIHRLFKNWEEK